MFGYQNLILNFFALLAFLSPQSEIVVEAAPQSSFDVVVTTGHRQSPAVIELGSYLNEIIESSQSSKLPVVRPFDTIQGAKTVVHEDQLLYFQIGNAIELELTATSIIFPFHCFT